MIISIKRVMWAGLGAVAMACAATAGDPDTQPEPQGDAGQSTVPHSAGAGGAPEVDEPRAGAGAGGVKHEVPDDGEGGYKPYCGGCSPTSYVLKCASRDWYLDSEAVPPEPRDYCAAAVAAELGDGAGGAGGAGGAAYGGAGAEIAECPAYVAPERVEEDEGGCIAWYEDHALSVTCVIDDECCVIVAQDGCGT